MRLLLNIIWLVLAGLWMAIAYAGKRAAAVPVAKPEQERHLGLAVLGSILITENVSRVERTLGREGVPVAEADRIAHAISGAAQAGSGGASGASKATHAIQLDFAHSTQTVVYGMAAAMAVAFVVALVAMPSGRADQQVEAEGAASHSLASSWPTSRLPGARRRKRRKAWRAGRCHRSLPG